MMIRHLEVDLPEAMYEQLQQRATQAQRTIEAELLQVVATVVPMTGELTPELSELLAQMQSLDDTALWRAARQHLSKRALAQLQSLNYKRQREGLSEAEAHKANGLLREYERVILLRAQAISLLKERSYDITEFE